MRKKMAAIAACLTACCIILTACGETDVTESTVELKKDGKVNEYTIEDFSASYYDSEELQSFIKDTVVTYADTHSGSVKVVKSEVADQTASLILKYDSLETFRDFSRLDCFSGTIAEASQAGYDFDTDFIQVAANDSDADGSSASGEVHSIIPFSAIQREDDMKVFILGEKVNIIVPGKIIYVSAKDTALISDNTVSVHPKEDSEGERDLIYVIYK